MGNVRGALLFNDAQDTTVANSAAVPSLGRGVHAAGALDAIVTAADSARIVMVNERHDATADRVLTLELLTALRAKGYHYFAAEMLERTDTGLSARGYPIAGTAVPYTDEPVMGEILRDALRLGYKIVPYESTEAEDTSGTGMTGQQRRDRGEAQNLAAIFGHDSAAKVLVHAGYAHIWERGDSTFTPMAYYFRELSGINPVTVDQTTLSERGSPRYEHAVYRAAIASGLLRDRPIILLDSAGRPINPVGHDVDFDVLSPRTTFDHGRPKWMVLGGRRHATTLKVPECARRICFVEARIATEPNTALPVDRAEVDSATTVVLFLPPGRQIRILIGDESGATLRTAHN
jgi:hypothetical protein